MRARSVVRVTHDRTVYAFGSASFLGSPRRVVAPLAGMAQTPNGTGYWLVASDGGVFSYGDATFFGSMGATKLVAPVAATTAQMPF